MSSTVKVTALNVSGESAWGPEDVEPSTKIAEIQKRVAVAAAQHPLAIRLSLGSRVLNLDESLHDIGIEDEVVFTLSIVELQAFALEQYVSLLRTIASNQDNLVYDIEPLALEDIQQRLEFVRREIGVEAMPADLEAWLLAMLSTPKRLADYAGDFVFNPQVAFKEEEMDDEWTAKKDGLIYFNIFGDNDNVLVHLIDVEGKLGKDPGAVWHFNVWDDLWEVDDRFSLEFCLRASTQPSTTGCTVEQRPTFVAKSVEEFFKRWATDGKLPRSDIEGVEA